MEKLCPYEGLGQQKIKARRN